MILFLGSICFLFKLNAQAPNFLWAKKIGGIGSDLGQSIAVDLEGNSYICGNFTGTVDFDPGPGSYSLTGNDDAFISKFDALGNFKWAKQFKGSGTVETAYSVTIDVDGNIFSTGIFTNEVDFDPGPGIYNLTSVNTWGDVFISKLDATGNFVWAKQFGGAGYDAGKSIAVDQLGNVYTTGVFDTNDVDFDPGSGIFILNGFLGETFISKLDASGNFIWARQIGAEDVESLALDANGNVYTTGKFSGTQDFDPGVSTYSLTAIGRDEIFISKLDASGNFVWAKQLGGTGYYDYGQSIAVDILGNVYTTGEFQETADFDPGPAIYSMTSTGLSAFISKLDAYGNFVWAKQLLGNGNVVGYSITVDKNSNVYTTGTFTGIADFDPGSTNYNLSSAGNDDIFISKLDVSGNFVWAKRIGGSNTDLANCIKVDKFTNIYLSGYFQGTCNFNTNSQPYNLTSSGSNDVFITKLKFEQAVFNSPKLSLSKSVIQAGQTLDIVGEGFSSNSTVYLNFLGAGGRYNVNVSTNNQGFFTYSYSIPANASNGIVEVIGFDVATAKYSSPVKKFEIQASLVTPVSYLNITAPQAQSVFEVAQSINVEWSDRLQKKYGNNYYPMEGTSAYRLYRYRIEYQIGASGLWQLATVVSGKGLINSIINKSEVITINAPDNNCRVRVLDDYVNEIFKTSEVFSVISSTPNNLHAELVWDYSYPFTLRFPQGVVADGTSRLYVKISKLNQAEGPNLQSADISISDGLNTDVEMLGRVKAALITNAYSTEANDANSLAANTSNLQNGALWFWYVAPNDFVQNDFSSNATLSVRTVNVQIVAHYINGTSENITLPVKIARPPLILAHGLASSEAAWEQFHYDLNSSDYSFINSPIFKIKKAINLYPHYSYAVNALQLLSPGGSAANGGTNRLNSLQGNIDAMRQLGYACNQVDYVSHSMGGCVLRTAMTVYANKFYGRGSYAGDQYKSYGQGFVHKFISINTPHANTPVADAVTEFIPQAPISINLLLKTWYGLSDQPLYQDFIEPTNTSFFDLNFQSTDAVKDLQVNNLTGGKDLAEVRVKNHVIAGDVDLIDASTAQFLADMEPYLNIMDKVLDIMEKITLPPAKNYLQGLQRLNKVARVLPFIEWYSQQKGFPNFLGDGDLIVPLRSQLANLETSASNVSTFNNTSFLNSFHTSILNRTDVGNRVKFLLNSPIGSPLFGDVMLATSNANGSFRPINNVQLTSILNNRTDSFNKSRIEINLPLQGDTLFADSTINIEFTVKDTSRLEYIDIVFQGESNKSFNRSQNQVFSQQINPSFSGNQIIIVTAVYERDSSIEYFSDTITVNIQTSSPLIKFRVAPQVVNLLPQQSFSATYIGTFDNYIASIPVDHPDLIVEIADTNAVKYDLVKHSFFGISDSLTTYAIVTFKALSDTLYFINSIPLNNSECINRSNTSGNWNDASVWEKGIVPGECDSIVISSGNSLQLDTTTQIRSLYISPNSALNITDSLASLIIGKGDDGNRPLINAGSLNLTNGKVFLNGFIKLRENSSFTMTGGEIIIDGNTGYSSTSTGNGQHLFDVSNSIDSFSFSGGILQIIDPPLGNNSQAINCNYDFGDSSSLKLGDGVSTEFSNNPNGFGGNLFPTKIGKLVLDAATTEKNRIFINLNLLTIKSSSEIRSGNFVQSAQLNIVD